MQSLALYVRENKLRCYCLFTSVCHLVAALVMAKFAYDDMIPLRVRFTKQLGWWFPPEDLPVVNATFLTCPLAPSTVARDPAFRVQQIVLGGMGEIPVLWIIVSFHVLSFAFQMALGSSRDMYYDCLGCPITHLVEYTFSAPLMLVAMCAQFGITDVFIILLVATSCAGCMVLGIMAEHMRLVKDVITFHDVPLVSSHWLAHIMGWILLAASFVAMLSNLQTFKYCLADTALEPFPDWVFALAYGELVAFSLFGLVQFGSFLWPNPDLTEAAYITLSLTAKLGLGITIFAGNYMVKN